MKRNLLALVGLFAVLLVVFLIYQSTERKRLSEENIHDFFWADSNLIDSIAVKYGSWSYLSLQDGQWTMAVDSELTYAASTDEISNVIRTTNEMVLTDLISVNPAKQAKFKVDTAGGTVIQFFGGGVPLSDFILGRVGQDFSHTYVRRQGSDSVFLARGKFNNIYSKAPPQWMDRRAFGFEPQNLMEVRWKYPDEETRLSYAGNGKFLVSRDPDFTPTPGDSSESTYKFDFVSTLGFNAFLPKEQESKAAFDEILLQLTAIDSAGTFHELIFAADTATYKRYFAIRPGSPRPVGVFFKNIYDRLTATYDALLPADTTGF